MHILIAEDQRIARLILATHLRDWGYRVTETSNGIEALDYLLSHNFDIDMLITDWNMPGMEGLELARKVRSLSENFQYIYIILLTGKNEYDDRIEGFEQGGVDDYVVKPFEANELHLRIQVGKRLIKAERSQRNYGQHLETIVRDQTKAIREIQNEIINRLFSALKFYDQDTGNHVRRIGVTSAFLSKIMGLPAELVDAMHSAAPLHDIGKIGIPDTILLKPGLLSFEEFERMKEHTLIGSNILSGSHNILIQLAEKISCQHHENWDGTGYPHGLVGEEISLEARIVSVLDVYDALLSDRIYRKGIPEEKALEYIVNMRGNKFDPNVCDAFLNHMDQIRIIYKNMNNIKNSDSGISCSSKDFIEDYIGNFS